MNAEEKELLEQLRNDLDEVLVRITVHELALQIIAANLLADLDPGTSQEYKIAFLKSVQTPLAPYIFASLLEGREGQMSKRTIQVAENFIEKVNASEQRICEAKRGAQRGEN